MKLASILTLNESSYPSLSAWEAAAKKAGYDVTKDNKTGTYHAWAGTSHKGSFRAGSGKGNLTEGLFDRFKKKAAPAPQRMPIDAEQRAFIKKYFPSRHNADVIYSPGKYVLPDSVRAVSGKGIVNFTNYDGNLTAHVAYHKSSDDANNPKATPLTHFDEPINGPADMEKLVKLLNEATAPRKGTVAWEREQQRKKKDRDPEETKRIDQLGNKDHMVGNAKVKHEDISEADKHSFVGKIQRGSELKKKVDSTFKDIGDAQKKGDHTEAGKAFRKHERYANLERPGTWTKVKESTDKDMTGCKCTKCGKGTYQETSQMDDMDGVLHCTNCGMKVDRYKTVNEHIIKHGDGYRLVSKKTGKNLGDFPTKAAAEKHEREVEYFKHKNESVEEGIGDTIKRGVKSVKRAAQGWGDGVTPKGIKHRAGEYSDDEVKGLAKGYNELRKTRATLPTSTDVPKHSPAGLQKRVIDREMKKRGLGEGVDPQDAKSKWTVTYDTYGSNKDVPLKKGATKTVYADTAEAACAEIKKLVGGRNHKAECIRKPV